MRESGRSDSVSDGQIRDRRKRIRKLTSVGIGQLDVTWSAPKSTGNAVITGYTASASAAALPAKTCTSSGPTFCTIRGLTSGVMYRVSVTATNSAGTSPPSDAVSDPTN